jgi:hypothetical protein
MFEGRSAGVPDTLQTDQQVSRQSEVGSASAPMPLAPVAYGKLTSCVQLSSSHPLLRLAYEPNPRQQYRPCPRVARSSTHSHRCHQGRQSQARRVESARASLPLLRQLHAHHRDLLAGATAQAPPDAASAEDQVRHLMTIPQPPPRKAVRLSAPLLSRPRLSSLQRCVHHATATPIFRHTPARSQKNASPPSCNVIATTHPTSLPTSAVARTRPNPHS